MVFILPPRNCLKIPPGSQVHQKFQTWCQTSLNGFRLWCSAAAWCSSHSVGEHERIYSTSMYLHTHTCVCVCYQMSFKSVPFTWELKTNERVRKGTLSCKITFCFVVRFRVVHVLGDLVYSFEKNTPCPVHASKYFCIKYELFHGKNKEDGWKRSRKGRSRGVCWWEVGGGARYKWVFGSNVNQWMKHDFKNDERRRMRKIQESNLCSVQWNKCNEWMWCEVRGGGLFITLG